MWEHLGKEQQPLDLIKSFTDLEKSVQHGDGRWVTLNGGTSAETGEHHGTHVFIDGAGHITKGPKALVEKDAKKKEAARPKEPHEMSIKEYRTANPKMHPETQRVNWLNSVIQHVKKGGQISKEVHEKEPWLQAYIDNGFKHPRKPREKLAGEGMPFKKEQTEKNSEFLREASHAFFHHIQGDNVKEMRKLLHKEGYDSAIHYIATYARHPDKHIMDKIREIAEADKAKGNGHAPDKK